VERKLVVKTRFRYGYVAGIALTEQRTQILKLRWRGKGRKGVLGVFDLRKTVCQPRSS